MNSWVLDGFNRPQSSKTHNYVSKVTKREDKAPKDAAPSTKEHVGPQSYQINYGVTENKARGGSAAFGGLVREKFKAKTEKVKPVV